MGELTSPRSPVLLAALTLLLAACATGSEEPGVSAAEAEDGSAAVTVQLFTFRPQVLEIEAGTTVTWTNEDEILHTVTAGTPDDPDESTFDGQLDDAGASFSFSFDESGTVEYFCSRHPTAMTGAVLVG